MPSNGKSTISRKKSLSSSSSEPSTTSSSNTSSITATPPPRPSKFNDTNDEGDNINRLEYESRIAFIQKQHARMLSALHQEMELLKRKNQGNK